MKLNNKGFTLMEVLAAVAIIAIIATLTAPSIISMITNSKNKSNEILIENIRVAAEELYQEIEYLDTEIYAYDRIGITENEVVINDNYIEVNLQTLVSNGFLSGTNQEISEDSANKNKKIILDTNGNDISGCSIKITKVKNGNKACYEIEVLNEGGSCPTTEDFGGSNQCTS